jgi:prolyl 4-hydroxylase
VIIFDNFVKSEEADALIRGGELVGFDRSTGQGAVNSLGEMEKVRSTTRTSSNAWCTGACEALPEVKAVTDRIEEVTGVPRKNYEPFQILEYEHDQFYRMHHDSEGRDPKPSGNRIMTFFLYLSDVEEGGETLFNKLDLAVKPKKGRALVWPSVKDDEPDFWDDRMHHEAKDVVKGKKYAANHWIHLNDYAGPNLWGCTGTFD